MSNHRFGESAPSLHVQQLFDLVVTVIGDVECAFEVASVDLLDVLIISLRPIPVLYVHFFNTNHRHHCIVNHLGLRRTAWYSLYTVPTVLKAKSTGTPKSMHSSPPWHSPSLSRRDVHPHLSKVRIAQPRGRRRMRQSRCRGRERSP
jgi:hypothetical protein